MSETKRLQFTLTKAEHKDFLRRLADIGSSKPNDLVRPALGYPADIPQDNKK